MRLRVKSMADQGPQAVGVKAYNLTRLSKKFRVPEYFVIPARAYLEYRRRGAVGVSLKRDIEAGLARLLAKGKIAVRSSCTAEDQKGASFAGVYKTVLGIEAIEQGMDAVIEVWRSTGSERAAKYRDHVHAGDGEMAVIVQHQLDPETSGVMVTQSPFSINEVLIECCKGLGDQLVSGRLVPSRYRVRNNRIIEQKGDDILSRGQLSELVRAGKKIERIFGAAQDVEWAFEKGRLHILQSRPLFVRAARPEKRGTVWCNANVRETIPDPISPMMWSIFDTSFFPGIIIDVFGFPMSRDTYRKHRIVEMLSGRLYWNINNALAYAKAIGPLLVMMRGDQAVDPQMATAFQSVDIKALPDILPRAKMFIFSFTALARLTYYLVLAFFRYGWMRNKIEQVNSGVEAYCDAFEISEDLETTIDKARSWRGFVIDPFAKKYFGGILLGAFHVGVLTGLMSLRLGKNGEILARKALAGIVDKTGEMATAVGRLAALASAKIPEVDAPRLRRLYRRDPDFRAGVEGFMNEFGHRGPAEFDIASRNWREDYDVFFSIVAAAGHNAGASVQRTEIVRRLIDSSRPLERFFLKLFIPRLEAFIPLRENGKHFYLKAAAKSKEQLLACGRRLAGQGYIKGRRDIFFLTLHDLESIAGSRLARRDTLRLIDERKRQWQAYARAEVPDIIYENGERVVTQVKKSRVMTGEALSFGRIRARARIISDFSKAGRLKPGEILVTHHADPGWTPLFTFASGLIIEVGGVICHAAMVARELGIPAVAVVGATSLIKDGSYVEIDADNGLVTIV